MFKHRTIIFALIIILITNLLVLLNINYLREFAVFFSLSVLPGLLILKILNIKCLNDNWEKLVLTIGISYSITIFLGLITNFFFMVFTTKPLTTINLLLSFDCLMTILLVLTLIKSRNIEEAYDYNIIHNFLKKLNSYDKLALTLVVFIFIFSIMGANVKVTSYNPINIIFMVMILGLITYLVSFYNKINKNIFPIAIISISFSILLGYTLLSPYIYGSDSANEFHFFKLIINNSKWAIFENNILDSSISISILPAVYQILSNFNVNYAFKLSLLLPLTLNPLIIYLITKKYVKNDIFAFLAAVFIISQSTFFSQLSAYRNYIALFFFGLLIMIMIRDKVDYKWSILYILFIFSAIVSHYTTAYIIFGIFLLAFVMVYLIQLFLKYVHKNPQKSGYFDNNSYLTIGIILLTFAFIFLWHGQLVGQSFDSGIGVLYKTIMNLFNFYNADSSTVITAATGGTLKDAPLTSYINFFVYWVSIFFIIIGVTMSLINYLKKPKDSIVNLNLLSLSLASIITFAIMLVLPTAFKSVSAGRVYSQIMIILICFFVLGVIFVSNKIENKKPHLVIFIIVLLSFSCSSGLISQVSGSPNSILLNSPQNINDNFYVYATESYSAVWLGDHRTKNNIYADSFASYRLISMGMLSFSQISRVSLIDKNVLTKGYLYLSHSNTLNNTYSFWKSSSGWEQYNMSDLKYKYENKSLVYNSGGSEIWYS